MKNQALSLFNQGKYAEAAEVYKSLLLVERNDALVWYNLSVALHKLKSFEAAVVYAKRAVEISGSNPVCLINYGNTLAELDRMDESLTAFEEAIPRLADNFLAQQNYATALSYAGQHEKALLHLDIAGKLNPEDGYTSWLRASILLKLGDFKKGWREFEARKKLKVQSEFKMPRWQGEDLTGKTILLHEEQGAGDTILCSRYIPLVKARGGKVVLMCKPYLQRLLKTVSGLDGMVDTAKTFPGSYDYELPVMSLPGIFDSIPQPPDLYAPETEAKKLFDIAGKRLKVGIVWSGNPDFPANHKRAVSFKRFLELAAVPGVQLYSLQKGAGEGDVAAQKAQGLVIELGPYINDFADTAAMLKHLDLVIMTDSAVAHVAGSLGVPVWNLLSYDAYWLYQLNREDCPWYPSMRLFRQSKPGDWDGVFEQVASELYTAASALK